MSRLLLTFYGDDFTGSTDALEQLTLAGVRTLLFLKPPTRRQLARWGPLDAVGVAGCSRAMTPRVMTRELPPVLRRLKALGAPLVHYKVCSTFDSSPRVGSIGRVIDLAGEIFPSPFVPLLVAAPALGRYCVFGNLFARYGIGSQGAIYRLDRHPSISRHPVTPMTEADLRLHLARQTRRRIGLFDILKVALPPGEARAALEHLLREGAEVVLFDALDADQLPRLGALIHAYADPRRPLFVVGSSGVETALAAYWREAGRLRNPPAWAPAGPAQGPVLVASGSCSPITQGQIRWALRSGFVEVPIRVRALTCGAAVRGEVRRVTGAAVGELSRGKNVVIHTLGDGIEAEPCGTRHGGSARMLGTLLGRIVRAVAEACPPGRVCIAGGDTSGYAARALGMEALTLLAPLTPGAPVCRAHAPGSPLDGLEIVFKGGQVGGEDYLERLRDGAVPGRTGRGAHRGRLPRG